MDGGPGSHGLNAEDMKCLQLEVGARCAARLLYVTLTQVTEIGEMVMQLAVVGTARLLISPFLAPLGFTG